MLDSPLGVFLSCFAVSSISGIAVLLRSGQVITVRTLLAAALYTGCLGLTIGTIWYNYFAPTNTYFLIGMSCAAGLGGVSLVDVITQALIRGGLKIKITMEDPQPKSAVKNPTENP